MLPGLDLMQEVAAAKWSNWRRRHSQARDLPDRFEEVLRAVAAFVDPVLDATAPTLSRWNSVERAWMQGAP